MELLHFSHVSGVQRSGPWGQHCGTGVKGSQMPSQSVKYKIGEACNQRWCKLHVLEM